MVKYIESNVHIAFASLTRQIKTMHPELKSDNLAQINSGCNLCDVFSCWFSRKHTNKINRFVNFCASSSLRDFQQVIKNFPTLDTKLVKLNNYELTDFELIKRASVFCGVDIPELSKLTMRIVNKNQIKRDLLDNLLRFIERYLLLILGEMIYYLEAGLILKNLYRNVIDTTMDYLTKDMISNSIFDYDTHSNTYKKWLCILRGKHIARYGNTDNFDADMRIALNKLWNMYYPSMHWYNDKNDNEKKILLSRIPDKIFLKKNLKVYLPYLLIGLYDDERNNSDSKCTLYPKVIDMSGIYLTIEI